MLVKMEHVPRDRGENKTCLKAAPSTVIIIYKDPIGLMIWEDLGMMICQPKNICKSNYLDLPTSKLGKTAKVPSGIPS